MASSGEPETTAQEDTASTPRDIANAHRPEGEIQASTPVEMTSLSSKPAVVTPSKQPEPTSSPEPSTSTVSQSPPELSSAAPRIYQPLLPATSDPPFPMTRQYSTAIGPSSEASLPIPPTKDGDTKAGPTLLITLLLTSGARHPFLLDSKYLAKREVKVEHNDPFNLSVYKLKELILREWRDEWEIKPASPSYIRLISFGKLLDDKGVLRDSKFSHDTPNVVHMTIKPQDYIEDEDAKAGGGNKGGAYTGASGREGRRGERSVGCRCVVM